MRTALLAGLLVLSAGCNTPAADVTSFALIDSGEPTQALVSSSDWVIETVPSRSCFRLRISDHATTCISTTWNEGDVSHGAWHLPDGRTVEWVVLGGQRQIRARVYSSQRNGEERQAVQLGASDSLVVVELAADEDGWGIQLFRNDGTLALARSLLD